jgi:uncharacterized protein involved in outer membrane biogenesis/outer membrane protein OmpA-like peptidoglycan-associated protein
MGYRPSRRLIISTAVVATLLVAFILIFPEVVRHVAINRLQSVLTVPVKIDDVDINLFTGRAAVEGLTVGASRPRPILSLPALAIEFSRPSLLTGQINLHRIVLQQPEVVIERLGPKNYNVLEVVRFPQESQESETGPAAFAIEHLTIHGGEVVFIDHTQEPNYEMKFSLLELAAGPISSVPSANVTPTNFTVGLEIAGGTVKLAGSSRLFGDNLETQMTADVANVKLEEFSAYMPYGGRLNLEKSLLNGQARYVLASSQGKVAQHYLDSTLKTGNIDLLAAAQAQPIMQINGITARDIHVDLLRNEAQIGALIIAEPYLLVRRDAAGFNFQQFMPARDPAAQNVGRNQEHGAKVPLMIKNVAAESGTVEFVDEAARPVVKSTFESVALAANDVMVLPDFATGQITAEGQLGKGLIGLTGELNNQPLHGQFSLTGKRLPFEPFRGYLNQLFNSANSSGDYIDGQLKIAFAPADQTPSPLTGEGRGEGGGEIVTSISGNLQGHNLALQFADTDTPFLATERLGVDLRTIRLGSNPRIDIDRIAFAGARLRVLRNKGGDLNLRRLWASDERRKAKPARERNEAGTTLAIRSITVDESNIEILDRNVSPNYTTTVSNVRGNLSNLLPNAKRADLELNGLLGDDAKLSLSGWLTPFTEKPYLHLEGTIQSYALPPLNPYATEYISHRIQQGQITTDIDYTLKGDKLQATADVTLQNLRVGERTGDEFAQRVGIPLELAVALLQDINGVIRLQLAINSERSPELNIADLVWTAVRNAIVKAITTPFRLVGNILTFGGRIGEIRIEPVSFEPGTRELRPQSKKQLEDLASLLKEKPQLELKLNGSATQGELDALKKKKFWERVQSAEAKNYHQALIRVYRELGGITQPATPLTPRAEASLERFIMERIEVSKEELRNLARERAEIVGRELQQRGIDAQRLSANASESALAGESPAVHIEITS